MMSPRSRAADEAQWVDRLVAAHPQGPPSPVGYPLPSRWVAEVRARFHAQGFLIVRGALSEAEVDAADRALSRVALPRHGDHRPLVTDEALADMALEHLDHPRLLPWVLALMGANVLAMGTNVTVIPPGAGPMVWHEDGPRPWSYPAVDGRRPLNLLRMGLFLEDLSAPRRGNLWVVPGSHHLPFSAAGDPASVTERFDAVPLLAEAGDAVLFHNGLWHSTHPNTMSVPRRVLYTAWAPTWHRVVDYGAPPAALLDRIDRQPAERAALLRQLVGADHPDEGPPGYFFPDTGACPALRLIRPEHAASGA